MHSVPGPGGGGGATSGGGGGGGGGNLRDRQAACYSALFDIYERASPGNPKNASKAREVCYVDNPPTIRG